MNKSLIDSLFESVMSTPNQINGRGYNGILNEDGGSASGAGCGTVADLGEPPVHGLGIVGQKNNKKIDKSKKRKVRTLNVTEAVDDFNDSDISLEDENVDKNKEDPIAIDNEAPHDPDNYNGSNEKTEKDGDLDYSEDEVLNAKNTLEDEDLGLSDNENEESEDERRKGYKKNKVLLSTVLKYRVNRPIRNSHSQENLLSDSTTYGSCGVDVRSQNNPIKVKPFTEKRNKKFIDRLFFEALEKNDEENDPIENDIVLGEVSRRGDRYVFAARTQIDNAQRDFVFEGDYDKVRAILVVLRATLKDYPGRADEIMKEVGKFVGPVQVYVDLDSLLTEGVQYAQQIITK